MRPSPAVAFTILLTSSIALPAAASTPAVAGGVRITGQWIRALGGSIPAAGYFTLENDTGAPIRLVGASSPECGSLTLHQTVRSHVDSRMTALDPQHHPAPMGAAMDMMQPVESLAVPPHGVVRFAPGSYHLMCEQASARVHAGAAIGVRFQFADASSLESLFPVRGARTVPPDQDKAASTLSP